MRLLLLLGPVCVLAFGCSPKDTGVQKGSQSNAQFQTNTVQKQIEFQGTWKFVSIVGNGKTTPPERIADMKVTISGQQFTTTKGGKIVEQASLVTDSSKKSIDLTITEGEGKGQKLLGVYEISGDTLRIAMSEPGAVRPTEIVNREGLRQDIWELRRE
jgi:uncharacterized protein (TIGR03067 family)